VYLERKKGVGGSKEMGISKETSAICTMYFKGKKEVGGSKEMSISKETNAPLLV
jgi:hypothetical protein